MHIVFIKFPCDRIFRRSFRKVHKTRVTDFEKIGFQNTGQTFESVNYDDLKENPYLAVDFMMTSDTFAYEALWGSRSTVSQEF